MNRYENYLETGFEWIGKIPYSWGLARVGKFFTERSEKVDDVTYPPLSVTMNGIVDQLSDVAKSNDNDNRKLVKKDDFVINSRSDRKGSSGIAPRDGSVSLINIVLAPKNIDPKYIENLFKSYYFKEEYFRNGKGIHWDLWTTRWEQFKNINIPIPPIEEQKLISRYLDKKTSQIDSLVENIQKKIEILKEQRTSLINHYVTKGLDPNVEMKDSGIEWIGEIPKHWSVKKLKNFATIFGRIGYRGYTVEDIVSEGEGSVTLGPGNIKDNKLSLLNRTYISTEKYEESPEIQIFLNDIIFVKTGSTIGKSCIIEEQFETMTLNPQMIVLKEITINNKFFYYQSITQFFQNYFETEKVGGSTPTISQDKIRNFPMLNVPTTEQKEIVELLNHRTTRIEQTIGINEQKLKLINEYRQSLISSVVTGKVRVTEDMI
ncbi:restriction endonuclease subunit S [Pseudoalteromonas sp. SCSIO 43088]|uniref:restriction endonuclease subunit S n=1 Tax=Pseudoalteromonas sp. SCSIO 43088 TaxID=2822846 RepID=UPI00202B775A|nr:restriction endonuclease subunit S [Pseudoalteromonas sp. SCSIO 43088]URQ86304.1 restriction endonuclease subunit S [Pseudoalteromonas sp. SCSIO 43088]